MMIAQLYEYYMKHVDQLPTEYVLLIVNGGEKKSRVVLRLHCGDERYLCH